MSTTNRVLYSAIIAAALELALGDMVVSAGEIAEYPGTLPCADVCTRLYTIA